jgi:hypothetical protein
MSRPRTRATSALGATAGLQIVARGSGFVAIGALREALETLPWAPIQLATRPGARPISPRLPHALVLTIAFETREGRPVQGADLSRLAAQVEGTPPIVADALRALLRAGILEGTEGDAESVTGDDSFSLPSLHVARRLLVGAPLAQGLHWRRIAGATAGSPSAWVAAHALADWLDGTDDWVSVPRNLLQPVIGAGLAGVRNALDALVAAGVLDRREVAGRASHYRFSSWARGLTDDTSTARPGLGHAPPSPARRVAATGVTTDPTAVTPAPAAVPTASAPGAGTGPVEVTINGVTLEAVAGTRIALNAPGMQVSVDIGPDGRTRISVVPPG